MDVSFLPLSREEKESFRRVENRVEAPSREFARLPDGQGVREGEKESLKIVETKETEIKSESPMVNHEESKVAQVEKVAVILPAKEQEPVAASPVQSEGQVISVSKTKTPWLERKEMEIEGKQEKGIVIASIGNTVPQTDLADSSLETMKSPPLSESEILFAQPRYAENPKPFYPREAKKKGYEGEVLLRVEVLSNGRVGEIEVKRSSGHEVLDRSAMTAVKQWKFIPARKGETPVPAWVHIPIAFQLR